MKRFASVTRWTLAILAVAPMVASAWNPYDTDSSRSGGYAGPDWSSSQVEPAPADSQPASPPGALRWDDRSGWYETLPQTPDRRGDVGQTWPPAPSAGRWDDPDAVEPSAVDPGQGYGDDAGFAARAHRYRFREDPKLDAPGGLPGAEPQYQYRPLNDTEMARRRGVDGGEPRWRERDLQPQGPWRSYEDEGSVFGYHPAGPDGDRVEDGQNPREFR